MGFLSDSDVIVSNTTDLLDDILNSKSSIFLSGLGQPILGTWYNGDDILSTSDTGLGNIDSIRGQDSPLRYNKIEKLPIYNITKEIQSLELVQDEHGLMDMNLEIEPILLPNTIKPKPYDYLEYRFMNGRNIFFRANNVQITSIKSNGFYKVSMHMVDVDSGDYPSSINELTVKTFQVNLDNVGTDEKCVISDIVYKEVTELKEIQNRMMSDYIDLFFSRQYNAFILRGYMDKYTIYDPFLTQFIIKNNLIQDDIILCPVVLEQDADFRPLYNKTVFRSVELRESRKNNKLVWDLSTFSKTRTNPFDYYGEEVVFAIKLYEDTSYGKNRYMNWGCYDEPHHKAITNLATILEKIILKYFQESLGDIISKEDIESLKLLQEMEYTDYYFYTIPIVVFIINAYLEYLHKQYT